MSNETNPAAPYGTAAKVEKREETPAKVCDIPAVYPEYWSLFIYHYAKNTLIPMEEAHEAVMKIEESAFTQFAYPPVEVLEDYLCESPLPQARIQKKLDFAESCLNETDGQEMLLTDPECTAALNRRIAYLKTLQKINYL